MLQNSLNIVHTGLNIPLVTDVNGGQLGSFSDSVQRGKTCTERDKCNSREMVKILATCELKKESEGKMGSFVQISVLLQQ